MARSPHKASARAGAHGRTGKFLISAAIVATLTVLEISTASAQVETVTVTARKRAENVQNVPVAVSVMSGAQLQKFDITDIEKVAAQSPELVVQRGPNGSGADISLRGIGSSWENIGIAQSVAVNVDGVYFGQGRVLNDGFFDMKQVQIFKGPQALYYGKNATAGVIALETNDPGDTFEAMARVGYEFNSETPSVEAVVSGPVTDTFGLRLAVRGSKMFGGLFRNDAPGGAVYNTFNSATFTAHAHPTDTPQRNSPREQSGVVRLTGKWQPTNDFTFTVKATADSYKNNNPSYMTVPFYCPVGGHTQTDPAQACKRDFASQYNDIPKDIAASDPLLGKHGGRQFNDYSSYTIIGNAEYTTPKYSFSSVTGYQHLTNAWASDQDYTGTPAVMAGENFTWDAVSTEARVLTTFDFPVNFNVGVYYQSTSLTFAQDVLFAGSENSAAADPTRTYVSYSKAAQSDGTTYAAFGQLIWDIVPDLELTAGARYTHETVNSSFRQPYVNPFLTFLFVQYDPANPSATEILGKQSFDNFSPEVILTWKPTSNLTVYGGFKKGFKSGGFSSSAIMSTLTRPSDLTFRPEKAEGMEGGIKSTWFDDQLSLNLAVYDYLYKDLQIDFFNTPTFNYITLNAASARTKGFELQAEYVPESVRGLTLRGSLNYNEAHYGHFLAPCSPAGLSYDQGCTYGRNIFTGAISQSNCDGIATACDFMDVTGEPTALAPRWTGTIGADYNTPVGSGLVLGLSGHVKFSSSYLLNGFPSKVAKQLDRQGSYATFDAALRLGDENDHWQVALIGKNLTNEFILLGGQGMPLSGGGTGLRGPQTISDQGGTVANPRTIALQFTYRY